jgi:hypothetical protein
MGDTNAPIPTSQLIHDAGLTLQFRRLTLSSVPKYPRRRRTSHPALLPARWRTLPL